MYDWVTNMHAHLGGECQHKCSYCYVDTPRWGRAERYTGELRLIEDEFKVKYDEKTLCRNEGKYPGVIFIEHMNDLFAESIPDEFIVRILEHCKKFPENTYVFQTKNPARYSKFLHLIPTNSILGTTIETNRDMSEVSKAPSAKDRYEAMKILNFRKFLTCEPLLDFDVEVLAKWISEIKPEFLNLGADSKGNNLVEPTYSKILLLVAELKKYNIEVREKHNIQRLIDKEKIC